MDPVEEYGAAVLEELLQLLPGDPVPDPVVDPGIPSVADDRAHDAGHHREYPLDDDIQHIAVEEPQGADLAHAVHGGDHISGGGEEIALLVGADEGAFIGEDPVGGGGVEEVDQEDQDRVEAQLAEELIVRRQMGQQGDEAQAEQDDDAADDPVQLAEELHQHQHPVAVLFLDWFIELEYDGGADAQVRQGQDGQDVREFALDALVADAQGADEDRAGDKAQNHHQDSGAQAGGRIEEGVLCPCHLTFLWEFMKPMTRS